jgi:hypothetical protein
MVMVILESRFQFIAVIPHGIQNCHLLVVGNFPGGLLVCTGAQPHLGNTLAPFAHVAVRRFTATIPFGKVYREVVRSTVDINVHTFRI